ncbi:NACHT, LRR and PYD domains-containing protein 1b allele 2-like [Colossoma macropomum]|uniref:NACHT, LRR and PYD domains-containing protein 1b allele 2-like n=1 Tax=Colossoma macropomum TaxID=42526 RepID=UPI001864D0FB|nr:NACHT, LRR and PYD domains-containing protein 1b allele 2-like [Colossoma macropomum]
MSEDLNVSADFFLRSELRKSSRVNRVLVYQRDRKWTKEERLKMKESVLLIVAKHEQTDPHGFTIKPRKQTWKDVLAVLQRFGSAITGGSKMPTSEHKNYSEKALSGVGVISSDSLVEDSSSASAQHPYDEDACSDMGSQSSAADGLFKTAEGFVPEMAEYSSETENSNMYRFLCPHSGQFQCSETNLVFEMEWKGEVLYKIESWDPRFLDGLGQMQPAGPLYSVDCFEGSLSHLHLPHCEIQYEENQLVVAHFTGENTEIIQPLNVTKTHVIINIQDLSLFGLLKKMILYPSPINAQVLLFYKETMDEQKRKKLHIHLLPENVPVKEVEGKHMGSRYFETSSTCELLPGRRYRPLCDPYVSEPKVAKFKCDCGPNYHPTFVVFLQAEEVTVSLLDEDDMEVWEPHQILLTTKKPGNTTKTSPLTTEAGAAFVDEHRIELIQRVSSVMEIVDYLHSKNMITAEMYSNIQTATPSQKQMRILYRVLDSGGKAVKEEFYEVLKKKQCFLVDELEAGPSRA